MNPSIVFCTTCKNRTQHLSQTLPRNLADNANYPDCKFVVLDYNSQDHLIDYLKSDHLLDIASGRLVVYSMLPGPDGPIPFQMTHAKNIAHRLGILEGADILVNLDADNYTCSDFANYIAEQIDKDTYLWAKMIKGQFTRGISGRIVATKHQFLNAGGYDEKCSTWWSDDKDFNVRLGRLGYKGEEIPHKYLDAVSHNDRIRFKEYPHVKTGTNEDDFDLTDFDNTIVNFGNFGCGVVYKNFDFSDPIELSPLPTRIFGIGMHKTATTSLYEALDILGYDSAHWESAHWAKAIWMEMTSLGKSLTLEKHYALCDLPITILYMELDKAYPGSKFILTLRDEYKWVESVRKHFKPDSNRFRKSWDTDPFSHFIHKQIYGQKNFDYEIFLARYRRHNAEVLEYFKSRPNDLLVFNSNGGWPKLCNFLKRPIPDVLYPMRNGSNI
jgi:hypothetical protein